MFSFDEGRAKECAVVERGICTVFDMSFLDGEGLIDTLRAGEAFRIGRRGLNEEREYRDLVESLRNVLEGSLRMYLDKLGLLKNAEGES